jgi:CRISPR system Cascade subunit CasE
MTLHLIQILPNGRALARFAHRAGLPGDDPGYLWHRALRDAFGALAPQPFRIRGAPARRLDYGRADGDQLRAAGRGGAPARLLGYGRADEDQLRAALALAAPDLDPIFPADRITSKALPLPFAAGRRLAFETRICPIVRTKSSDGTRQRELDAFVHHALGMADEPRPEREPVYRAWLADRLAAAGCRLVGARMTSFRLAPLVRRRHAAPAARATTEDGPARRLLAAGGRPAAASRPEVVFDGVLDVTEPDVFAASLARGIGRHRAFGFGMLLLRPA